MVQRVSTVAFEGIEARAVDVQVQVAPGLPAFAIVRNINRLRLDGPRSIWIRPFEPFLRIGCGSNRSTKFR